MAAFWPGLIAGQAILRMQCRLCGQPLAEARLAPMAMPQFEIQLSPGVPTELKNGTSVVSHSVMALLQWLQSLRPRSRPGIFVMVT